MYVQLVEPEPLHVRTTSGTRATALADHNLVSVECTTYAACSLRVCRLPQLVFTNCLHAVV